MPDTVMKLVTRLFDAIRDVPESETENAKDCLYDLLLGTDDELERMITPALNYLKEANRSGWN